jgi:DegV family protein with EDD domain
MVKIITDSTSDLGDEIVAEFKVKVIPLSVTIGGKVFHDGVDINQQDLFALVDKYGELPKTAAPSVGIFNQAFDGPDEVVFIGISSKLSATVQNARLAMQNFPKGKVYVVDSRNLSTGIGLLTLRAAELSESGISASQIDMKLQQLIGKIHTSFVVDKMDYIYKGGRCTALQAVAGSVLKIHPVIQVMSDGTLGVKEKIRGTLKKGFQAILDDFAKSLNELDRQRVFITTTCSNNDDIKYLTEEVKRIAAPQDLRITHAGSVISSHCGPGSAGILYFMK